MDDFTVQAIALAFSYTIAIALRAAGLVDNVLETTTAAYCVTLPPTSLTLRDTPVISALLEGASLDPTRTPTAPPIALNFKSIPVPDRLDIRISPLARRLLINEDELERALPAKQRNDHAARIADEVATAWSSYEERLISRPSATKDAPWLQASPNGLTSYILALIVLIMTVVVIYVRLFRHKPTRRFPAAQAEVESGAPPAPPPSTVDDEVDAAQQEIDNLLASVPGPASYEERIPHVEILPAPAVAVPAAPAPVTPAPAPAPTAPAPIAPAPAAPAPTVQAPVVQAPIAPAPAVPAPIPAAAAAAVPAPVVVPSVPHLASQNPAVQSDEDDDDSEDDGDASHNSPHNVDALDTSPTSRSSDSEASNDLADDPLPFAHDDCLFATDANEPTLSDSVPIDVTNPVPRSASSVSIHDDTIIVNLPGRPAEMPQPLPSIHPTTSFPEANVLPLNSARPEADVAFQPESTDASFFDIADESSTPVVSLPRAHRGDEVNVGLSPALPCVTASNNAALQPSSVGDSSFSFLDETSPSASFVNLPRAIQANENDVGSSSRPQDFTEPSDDNTGSTSDEESEAENIDEFEMVARLQGMFSLRSSNVSSLNRRDARTPAIVIVNPTQSQATDSTPSSPQLQTPPDVPVAGPASFAATNEMLAQMLDNLRSKPAPSLTTPSIERSPSPAEEAAPSAGPPSVGNFSHLDFLTSRLVQSAASTATQSYDGVNLLPILFPDPLPAEDAVALDVRGQEQDAGPTAEDDQQPIQALDETEPRESGAEEEDVVNVHVPDEEPSKASVEPSSSISESSSPLDEGTAPLTLPAIPRDTRQAHEVSQGAPQYGETLYIAIPRPSIARVPPHQARPQAPIIRPTPQQERPPASAIRIAPPAPLECPRYRCTSPSAAEVPNDELSAVNFVWAQAPPYGIMRGSRLDGLEEISQAVDMAIARVEASASVVDAPAEAVATHPRIDDLQECEVTPSKVEMPVHSAELLLQATPVVTEARDDTPELPLPNATTNEDICTETPSPAEHVVAEPVPNFSETSAPPAPTITTMPAHGRRKTRAKGVKIVLQSNGPRNLGR
ncbi:uncharacterized protein SCHCODRAFT_01192535 [Schizophyllum commune H4-8]|nr:uncharacterized protein SCHCODRAFT_01192535 [Schizophyllum commune H4-8]KAI5887485.1 hypothetical protein SCHCODRAFT_01192535 [Schizophyllum commune H4-8]